MCPQHDALIHPLTVLPLGGGVCSTCYYPGEQKRPSIELAPFLFLLHTLYQTI